MCMGISFGVAVTNDYTSINRQAVIKQGLAMANTDEAKSKEIAALIVNRSAHILSKIQLAKAIIQNDPDALNTAQTNMCTIHDIEAYVEHWRFLVPDKARLKAGILHELSQQFTLNKDLMPQFCTVLGIEDEAVQDAYEDFYDGKLDTIFKEVDKDDKGAQDDIIAGLKWLYPLRGETLIKQGEEGKGLYILIEGLLRVQVEKQDDDGNTMTEIVGEIGPGEFIGEMSLLTGDTTNATVIALRDSDIVFLSRENFDKLILEYPELLRNIAVQIVYRVKSDIKPVSMLQTAKSFTILPISGGTGDFGPKLVEKLDQFGSTLYLTSEDMKQRLKDVTGSNNLEAYVDEYAFVDWLEEQERVYKFIVYEGDIYHPNWTRRAIQQANRILLVTRDDADPEKSALEALLAAIPQPELTAPQDLVILHESRNALPKNTRAWLEKRTVKRYYHVAEDRDYDRVVRYLRGRAVGIVFGGGGMRGAAHAGVIKAMEENGIIADYAGGTSAGAVVAAQYGLEWTVDKIMQETKEKLLKKSTLFQFTFPYTSFTTAKRLNEAFVDMFGGIDIEDLWTPAFTIASNLTQAKQTVMDSGSLHRAVRASTSLAGIHPPTVDVNNDLLLDGGGFNNTPADVMRQKVETGTVIAVDMGFTKREFPDYTYGDSLNGFSVLLNRLNPFKSKTINAPTIVSIIMRSNALWSIQATSQQIKQADLLLKPPVNEFGLWDLESADEIYQAGYDYASDKIKQWKEEGGFNDTFGN